MDALLALAQALGVTAAYHDAFGQHRRVPEATLRAICRALGHEAADEQQAARSLDRLTRERQAEVAPPVIVLRGIPGPLEIALRFSGDDATPILWTLHGEHGELADDATSWGALAPAEEGRRRLAVAERLDPGYYTVDLRFGHAGGSDSPRHALIHVIVAPRRAFEPAPLSHGVRLWALATQVYSLRTDADWGIGDFSSLAALVEQATTEGAAAIGINPLHALFLDAPEQASPYSPNSRVFLNPLALDVTAIEDFDACQPAQRRADELKSHLATLRARRHVDYAAVAAAKLDVLGLLYSHFRARHLGRRSDRRTREFNAFRRKHAPALRQFAAFEALRAHFRAQDPAVPYWRQWPADYRRPDGLAVAAFADANVAAIEFHEYLQWQAERQLAAVHVRARAAGMPIGIYGDLAVGFDSGGADAWANQDAVIAGFSAGAPPDPWNHLGQSWGFPPLDPFALRRSGYRPFIDVLRANMRHAGALRIDHVLGLMRMFWVPDPGNPADGAYVAYPFDELIAIVVLESHRNHCLIVGEDLGTLPEGLRERLHDAGLYSYRLLYFERDHDGRFRRPADYPAAAVAAVSTHDLPTLAGYWAGGDLTIREQLGLLAPEQRNAALEERTRDRTAMSDALRNDGLDPGPGGAPPMLAVHRYLARSAAKLAVVQLDDVAGEVEQINVPGTSDERPNWRRRYAATVAQIFADGRAQDLFAAVRAERPRQAKADRPVNGH